MKFLDVEHPFFRRLWVRVAVVLVCLGWALVEFLSGSPSWGMLFGAVGVYCAWQFLVVFKPADPQPERPTDPDS